MKSLRYGWFGSSDGKSGAEAEAPPEPSAPTSWNTMKIASAVPIDRFVRISAYLPLTRPPWVQDGGTCVRIRPLGGFRHHGSIPYWLRRLGGRPSCIGRSADSVTNGAHGGCHPLG